MPNTAPRKQFNYVDFLRNPPTKKTMYYMSAFTAVVATLLIILAIRPTLLTIDQISKEIKEKQQIYTALESKITAMASLDAQYAELVDDFESLELLYPTSGNFSLFMSNIDAVVARNGFVLNSLGFSDYDAELYDISSVILSPWNVQLSVTGPVGNIDNLFEDLEAMPMFPVIDSFSYGQSEVEGEKNFSISMRIYHIENNKFYSD